MSILITADNADELYYQTCTALLNSSESNSFNHISHEILDAHLELTNPYKNLMLNSRELSIKYALGEMTWYNSRNRSAKAISKYSEFWNKLADKDGNVNSNYGWCIHCKYGIDQWEEMKHLLITDPYTREAVIHIKEPLTYNQTTDTKDVNCTLTLQFLLRHNALNLIVNMRSNDVWLGLPYDLLYFTTLQIQMAMEIDAEVGTYYHNAGSLHMYNNNEQAIQTLMKKYDSRRRNT